MVGCIGPDAGTVVGEATPHRLWGCVRSLAGCWCTVWRLDDDSRTRQRIRASVEMVEQLEVGLMPPRENASYGGRLRVRTIIDGFLVQSAHIGRCKQPPLPPTIVSVGGSSEAPGRRRRNPNVGAVSRGEGHGADDVGGVAIPQALDLCEGSPIPGSGPSRIVTLI